METSPSGSFRELLNSQLDPPPPSEEEDPQPESGRKGKEPESTPGKPETGKAVVEESPRRRSLRKKSQYTP